MSMKFGPEGLGHYSKDSYRDSFEVEPTTVSIKENQVQMLLMKMTADLTLSNPYEPWFKEDHGHSLAERFRTYVEDPAHRDDRIDVKKNEELEALLAELRPTVH